jgi:glycosyltransferase involved in cell wall biosynthesis
MAQVPGGAVQISITLEKIVQEKIENYRTKWGVPAWGAGIGAYISESVTFKAKVELYAKEVDTIILSHPWLVDAVPNSFSGKVIYDAHNNEVELIKSQARDVHNVSNNRWTKLFLSDLISEIQEIEERAIRRSDSIICVSDYDLNLFKLEYPDSNFILIPSGFSSTAAKAHKVRKPNQMFFFGSAHPPNVAAARHLILIAQKFPKLKFVIAGDVCSYLKSDGKNVELKGRISEENLDKLLGTSTLFLNPITSGAGISLKLIRAMSSGIPILSTPLGARGFLEESEHVVFLSELKDFERTLNVMLMNPKLTMQQASNAKELVDRKYNWKSLSKTFNEYVTGAYNSSDKFYEAREFLSHNVLKWYSSGYIEQLTTDSSRLNLPPKSQNLLKAFIKKILPNRFHGKVGELYRLLSKSK